MTDNEIISIDEAIRHCYETYFERDDLCRECRKEHKQLAKWLEELRESRNTINRQAAEIERLQNRNKFLEIEYKNQGNLFWARVQTSNLEAIKGFAERLKRTSIGLEIGDDKKFKMTVVSTVAIDNLVKEMTEKE